MGGESSRASSPRARRESEANGKKCNSSLQILPRRTRALDGERPCVINYRQVHILERGFFYTTLNYTKFAFCIIGDMSPSFPFFVISYHREGCFSRLLGNLGKICKLPLLRTRSKICNVTRETPRRFHRLRFALRATHLRWRLLLRFAKYRTRLKFSSRTSICQFLPSSLLTFHYSTRSRVKTSAPRP